MRALLPEPQRDVNLHDFYATDWLEPGGVRADFICSVDGAVSAAGVSRGLQTPGDNRVFGALRDLADVVLVGSGTAIAEGYGAVRPGERRLDVRQRYGLAPALPIAVMSRSLRLDPRSPLFATEGTAARTLVLTCTAADAGRRRELEAVAEVIDCGSDTVEPAQARAALEERGLRRIVCEGGPTVLAQFIAAGALDELCLSISPLLSGPGAGRITAGVAWPAAAALRLTGLLEEDGALFCRYRPTATRP